MTDLSTIKLTPSHHVEGEHPIKAYFKDHIEAAARFGRSWEGMGKFAQFMLDNGRPFVPTAITFKGRRMEIKQCFQNATRMVMRNPKLTYVEGYVDVSIPIHHAWVLTPDGDILDPTLRVKGRKDDMPEHYWGIPFKREYLSKTIFKNGVYGLLDGQNESLRDLIEGKTKDFKA